MGRTALHYAAGYGQADAVQALVHHGATVDAPDRFGVTPLHWACLKAQATVVEVLLAANADPLLTASAGVFSGKSAIDLASAESHSAAVAEALTAALGAALFEQRKVLGRGGFGTVIKAVRRDTKLTVALKAVRIEPGRGQLSADRDAGTTLRGARAERDILSSVRHPFVVQLHCAFQTRQHLYLAIDYCAGGDLALHIKQAPGGRLPEHAACFVCAEVLLALEALHDAGVIHRDIKCENVLVDAWGHIKVADLNAAKRDELLASGGRTYTVAGTPFAAAPEVLSGRRGYTVTADWWSYGVLLFEALAGRPPYPKDQALMHAQARLIHEILHGERAPLPAGLSDGATTLVEALLVREESGRLSDPAALRSHAFFENIRWSCLLAKQVPSPLLPRAYRRKVDAEAAAAVGGGAVGGGGGGGAACAAQAADPGESGELPVLDVFAYPSHLQRMPLGGSEGIALSRPGDASGDALLGGLSDWDYVADQGEGGRGARLWQRARRKLDQLARLQSLSRTEFLIWLLLTLAANTATDARVGGVLSGT